MAMDVEVQRLQLGDVLLISVDGGQVEATVTRPIGRTSRSVLVKLRAAGHADFEMEWDIGHLVTVVRGP